MRTAKSRFACSVRTANPCAVPIALSRPIWMDGRYTSMNGIDTRTTGQSRRCSAVACGEGWADMRLRATSATRSRARADATWKRSDVPGLRCERALELVQNGRGRLHRHYHGKVLV